MTRYHDPPPSTVAAELQAEALERLHLDERSSGRIDVDRQPKINVGIPLGQTSHREVSSNLDAQGNTATEDLPVKTTSDMSTIVMMPEGSCDDDDHDEMLGLVEESNLLILADDDDDEMPELVEKYRGKLPNLAAKSQPEDSYLKVGKPQRHISSTLDRETHVQLDVAKRCKCHALNPDLMNWTRSTKAQSNRTTSERKTDVEEKIHEKDNPAPRYQAKSSNSASRPSTELPRSRIFGKDLAKLLMSETGLDTLLRDLDMFPTELESFLFDLGLSSDAAELSTPKPLEMDIASNVTYPETIAEAEAIHGFPNPRLRFNASETDTRRHHVSHDSDSPLPDNVDQVYCGNISRLTNEDHDAESVFRSYIRARPRTPTRAPYPSRNNVQPDLLADSKPIAPPEDGYNEQRYTYNKYDGYATGRRSRSPSQQAWSQVRDTSPTYNVPPRHRTRGHCRGRAGRALNTLPGRALHEDRGRDSEEREAWRQLQRFDQDLLRDSSLNFSNSDIQQDRIRHNESQRQRPTGNGRAHDSYRY